MAFLLSHIGLDLERVSAIDGAKLQFPIDDFDERGLRHRRRPNPYETGCFLGHAELVIRRFQRSSTVEFTRSFQFLCGHEAADAHTGPLVFVG